MNTQNKTTLSFVSLGCFKNLVDTEVLGGMLEKHNIKLVSPYEDTDWIAVNTCGFIRDAKEESIDEILAALEKKERGEIKHVAVFGCLTQRYQEELKENFKEADLIWGVNDLEELAAHIAAKESKKKKKPQYQDKELFLYNHSHKRIMTSTPNVEFIKISEGCNMKCAFCSIPQIRGPFRSRTIDSIVKEAENYRNKGVEELNLVSQNSTSFGKDRNNRSQLPELLKALSKIGFAGVRVLYLMPEEVNDEIIDGFSHPTILPYFDLPFQHVSPAVLHAMNRSGNFEKNMKMIEGIRKQYKDAVIRSSFIVGFPGETDEDYQELLRFASAARIERIGVFAYSDEENTDAFNLKEKIEPYIIEERKERLMDVSDANIESYNQELVDREAVMDFLPISPCPWDDQSTLGRVMSQAPDSDGVSQSNIAFDDSYKIYKIKITGSQNELLYGDKV